MWLMKYITRNSLTSPDAVKGSVNRSGSEGSAVSSSGEHTNLKSCAPYGVTSIPPVGEKAVVLPLDNGEVCAGVLSDAAGLQEGELRLRSKGGAEILLKNNGEVIINGRVIDRV